MSIKPALFKWLNNITKILCKGRGESKLPENYFVFFKQLINLWQKTIPPPLFFWNIWEDNSVHFKDYDPTEIAREKKRTSLNYNNSIYANSSSYFSTEWANLPISAH